MASVNQALADLVLQHRHYLLAVEEHALAQMGRVFDKALREVRTAMARAGFDPRTFTGRRLVRLEKQLAGMVELSAQAAGGELKATLREIIQAENVAQTGILLDALPKPMEVLISFERLPLAQIEQMIQTPLGGKTLNDRLKTMVAGAADDVRSALATSITLGEGIDPAARRIRQYVKGKTMYNAQRIARTEIHRAATAAQLHVYRRHKNILAGLTWYATLDRRTCAACAELDQMMWHYDRPPLLSEAPEPPLHPMCFIDPQVPVRVPGGEKAIGKIRVGDLVLTHKGRFRRVTSLIRQQKWRGQVYAVAVRMRRGAAAGRGRITVTKGHPILVKRKGGPTAWVPVQDIRVGDRLYIPARSCAWCGKLTSEYAKYCSNSCRSTATATNQWTRPSHRKAVSAKNSASMKAQYASGARDGQAITKAAHEATRKLWAEGRHPWQQPGHAARVNRAIAKRHGMSGLERLLDWALRRVGVHGYEQGYPIKRNYRDTRNRIRYYYADFAFPELQLVIEADGMRWRGCTAEQRARDARRDAELRALGWDVYHFKEADIRKDPLGVAEAIKDLTRNHAGDISFIEAEVVHVKNWVMQRSCTTYNFSVADDESYIASGIVVHNCRCTMVPSTKSWKQLGFDKQDLKGFPGLKDLDGKLARVPGYGVWFKRQPKDVQLAILGRKRWLDWKAGRFKLRDMVSTIPRRLKPLSPDQLAKVRGLGRRAKPKRRVVQPGNRAFKASEIRALINAEALKAGMSRKQLATYWRDVRAGRRLSLREQLASILNGTEEDTAAVAKKVGNFQLAVHRRLRALVKEAQVLGGADKVPGAAVRRTLQAAYKEPATKRALHALIHDYVAAANAQYPFPGMTFDAALEAFNEGMRTLRGSKFVKHGGGAIVKGHGDATVTIVVGGYKPSITARLRPARAFSLDQYTGTPEWYNRRGLVVAVPDGAAFEYREGHHSVLLDVSRIIELGSTTTAGEVEGLKSAFHELGHTWEYSDPRVNQAARRFFDRRARGEATRRLRDISPFSSYDYNEYAKPDRFWLEYTGKVYGEDEVPREVFSTATEHLPGLNMARPLQKGVAGDTYIAPAARDAVDWATYDPEHFELLLNAVAGSM